MKLTHKKRRLMVTQRKLDLIWYAKCYEVSLSRVCGPIKRRRNKFPCRKQKPPSRRALNRRQYIRTYNNTNRAIAGLNSLSGLLLLSKYNGVLLKIGDTVKIPLPVRIKDNCQMRARKVDSNQTEIVETFRQLGYSVHHTHTVGCGFPDIVVGKAQKNYLVEIKDGAKPPSKQKLTKDEVDFHQRWKGIVWVVKCPDDAITYDKAFN